MSIGVAIDSLPQRGLSFLEEFGPFDEISSGGGWANSMVIALIQRDFPGQVAIPQLVLLERVIELDDLQSSSVTDRLLARKVGAERIVSFARILREETMGQ